MNRTGRRGKIAMGHSQNENKKKNQQKEKGSSRDEIRALKEEVLVTLRNGLVFPNTILQIGRDRQLTFEESENASKCIYTAIANVEQKFFSFQNRHPA